MARKQKHRKPKKERKDVVVNFKVNEEVKRRLEKRARKYTQTKKNKANLSAWLIYAGLRHKPQKALRKIA